MKAMPPVHLKVELAVPTVMDQAGLLMRIGPGAIDGCQIVRQHDPAFKLVGPRIRKQIPLKAAS